LGSTREVVGCEYWSKDIHQRLVMTRQSANRTQRRSGQSSRGANRVLPGLLAGVATAIFLTGAAFGFLIAAS
jgi:hypothetical protein